MACRQSACWTFANCLLDCDAPCFVCRIRGCCASAVAAAAAPLLARAISTALCPMSAINPPRQLCAIRLRLMVMVMVCKVFLCDCPCLRLLVGFKFVT